MKQPSRPPKAGDPSPACRGVAHSRRAPWFVCCALLAMVPAGACNQDGADVHIAQIQKLQDNTERQGRLLALKDEDLATQAQMIQRLRKLEGDRAIERLTHVAGIAIERLSGGTDEDRDGVDDGVKVYLQLRDQDGDVIKATGSVHVRLLDLSSPPAEQLVGEVDLDPAALRPMWYGRLMTYHYTITIPWIRQPGHKTITVLVQYTDLLTGQAFVAQRVVEINGVFSRSPG